jgi:hypothetical protein
MVEDACELPNRRTIREITEYGRLEDDRLYDIVLQ